MAEDSLVKLPWKECYRTLLMVSRHWFRKWQQTLTWANVDPDLCRHMASIGHNELGTLFVIALGSDVFPVTQHFLFVLAFQPNVLLLCYAPRYCRCQTQWIKGQLVLRVQPQTPNVLLFFYARVSMQPLSVEVFNAGIRPRYQKVHPCEKVIGIFIQHLFLQSIFRCLF